MQNIKKAALLFSIFPYKLKKNISKHLSSKEKTKLADATSGITKHNFKHLLPVQKEFTNYMKISVKNKFQKQKSFKFAPILFILIFIFIFMLFYFFEDIIKNLIKAGAFYIIIAPVIFLYIKHEKNVSRIKSWYITGNLVNIIFYTILFSFIISIIMLIDNLLFLENIIELKGLFFIISLLVAVFFAPLIEELIFRKLIIDFLNRKIKVFISLPISAVIFSLAHIPNNMVDFMLMF